MHKNSNPFVGISPFLKLCLFFNAQKKVLFVGDRIFISYEFLLFYCFAKPFCVYETILKAKNHHQPLPSLFCPLTGPHRRMANDDAHLSGAVAGLITEVWPGLRSSRSTLTHSPPPTHLPTTPTFSSAPHFHPHQPPAIRASLLPFPE